MLYLKKLKKFMFAANISFLKLFFIFFILFLIFGDFEKLKINIIKIKKLINSFYKNNDLTKKK
jgi:Sec-independent protein translocase protein TatA